MPLLSDPTTRAYKWRQLALLSAAVVLVIAWQYFTTIPRYSLATLLSLIGMLAFAVAITVRRMFWYLADEVFEEGPVLIARRNGAEVRVRFEDIIDMYAVNVVVREGIAVQLRSKVSPFGERIVFRPPGWESVDRHQMDKMAAEIKSRIARGGAA